MNPQLFTKTQTSLVAPPTVQFALLTVQFAPPTVQFAPPTV